MSREAKVEASVVEAHSQQQPLDQCKTPSHLITLKENEWALWNWACLRSAGFPANQVLKLASSSCSAVADELLDAQQAASALRSQALELVMKELSQQTDPELRAKVNAAARRLQKGKPVADYPGDQETVRALEQFTSAFKKIDEIRGKLAVAYRSATEEISRAIQHIARGENFQRAIIWQNRSAFDSGIKPLLSKHLDDYVKGSKYRQKEELIATYLQRYCLKNDTIGFFGPVGWARLTWDGASIRVQPGKNLVATSKIYTEGWCLDALAQTIARDKKLRPWFAPRRAASMHLEGDHLYLPGGASIKLSEKYVTVLNACDGQRTARQLASEIISKGDSSLRDEGEIFEILDWMQKRGMISWTLSLPSEVGAGDRLKAMLEGIEDQELRREALAQFHEIDSAIKTVSQSAENADQLYTALTRLEERFTEITGAASTRGAGATYAARTLVYEDCRRDMDVQIGSEILQELREPLSLLLTSARWFTWEVAKLVRGMMQQVYEELARSTKSRTVDFLSLWTRVINPLLLSEGVQLYDPLTAQLQKKWEEILQIDTEKREVEYSTDELREKVNAAFAAPRPGWKFARYHSPDVMIVAPSVEAIQRGEHQFVLGEIHIGTNTLRASLFVAQHPSPGDLFEAIDIDFPQPRVIASLPKHWGGTTTSRTTVSLVAPKDYWLEVALDSPSGAQKSQVLTLGELAVEDVGDGLKVRTRDSRLSFDIVEFFGELLSSQVINRLRIESSGKHTPRVSFDRLVVCRESWQFSASEMAFALIKDEVERFVQARKWARSFGIPRFAFARVPVEIKPFYVDFDSPLYVGIFAKMVRRTLEAADDKGDEITVREMLPGLDMLWLSDNEQARYTSELRIVAVDLAT